jgi:hypothetical protein
MPSCYYNCSFSFCLSSLLLLILYVIPFHLQSSCLACCKTPAPFTVFAQQDKQIGSHQDRKESTGLVQQGEVDRGGAAREKAAVVRILFQ